MDKSVNAELFMQIRMAHRVVVAYYKRLFQLIRDVTNSEELGLNFCYWNPTEFRKPCNGSTNVFSRFEWELLPGICTNYLFYTAQDNNSQCLGDWMINFGVVSDTGVTEEHTADNQDPLELEISAEEAKSILRCSLIAPHKKNNLNWISGIWDKIDYPACSNFPTQECLDEENEIFGCAFEVTLDELIHDHSVEKLIKKIGEYRNAVIPK